MLDKCQRPSRRTIGGNIVDLRRVGKGGSAPPLPNNGSQLSHFRLLRLALMAPREERGREICRIAVTFRRAGAVFWGVWGRLPPPSVKKPGCVTEHPENDSENDQKRERTQHPQCRENPAPHGQR